MLLATHLSPRGAPVRLADLLGVSSSLVVQWARGKPVPVDRCPEIERATAGHVPCEELRADVRWHRVPDPTWPWHPQGRPLVDHTRLAAPVAGQPGDGDPTTINTAEAAHAG